MVMKLLVNRTARSWGNIFDKYQTDEEHRKDMDELTQNEMNELIHATSLATWIGAYRMNE